jgi:hypothetical protein
MRPAAQLPVERRFGVYLLVSCWRTALRHSDVLTMTGWMAPTRSRTVDCLPRQRFPSQEVIHRSRRVRARLRGRSQRAGPVRGQRVAWRGVHRMWCVDRRRIRLPHLNASCRPSPNLTPGRMRRHPGVRLTAIRHCDASPLRRTTGKTLSDIGFPTFDG